jgi:hypothetical protein
MNKKLNTILFIIGGTVFNVLVTVITFLVLFIICSKLLIGRISEDAYGWLLPVIFVASIAASFFIYRLVIKIVTKKVDVEKYFNPLFVRKRR